MKKHYILAKKVLETNSNGLKNALDNVTTAAEHCKATLNDLNRHINTWHKEACAKIEEQKKAEKARLEKTAGIVSGVCTGVGLLCLFLGPVGCLACASLGAV